MPSMQSIRYFIVFSCILDITFFEDITMINATGITQTEARAILQSKKNKLITMIVVETIPPTSSGIQCEEPVSIIAQSVMIVFVRSARSFLPKYERGILLSFSASVLRLTPLSTYVE